MNCGQIILQQLGGRRFTAMTGARDLIGDENSLMFRLPKGFAKNGINKVRITLDWTDTYTFEALKIYRGAELKFDVIEKQEGVYAEELQGVFTRITGLDTHL